MKKGSTLLEWIFIISLVGVLTSQAIPRENLSKIKLAKNQILLHLKYTRYIAMLDNKYDNENSSWYKKRWNLRFEKCDKDIGGLFYTVYSDENMGGGVNKEEVLKDPLTNNYIFATSCKKDALYDKSKFVLLTQEYGVENINISCNKTSTIGQIIFGNDGKIYAKNGNDEDSYEIKEPCLIELSNNKNEIETIKIYPNSGFIEA